MDKPIFEVGKSYLFHYDDGQGWGSLAMRVEAWDHPILKLKTHDADVILNVGSLKFLKAEPIDRDATVLPTLDELIQIRP